MIAPRAPPALKKKRVARVSAGKKSTAQRRTKDKPENQKQTLHRQKLPEACPPMTPVNTGEISQTSDRTATAKSKKTQKRESDSTLHSGRLPHSASNKVVTYKIVANRERKKWREAKQKDEFQAFPADGRVYRAEFRILIRQIGDIVPQAVARNEKRGTGCRRRRDTDADSPLRHAEQIARGYAVAKADAQTTRS